MQQLARAREHVDAGFGEAELARGLSALPRRLERARNVRAAKFAAVSLAAALLIGFGLTRSLSSDPLATSTVLQTHDGSLATRLSAETQLSLEHDAQDDVALSLKRGKGHFKVTPNPRRLYRVRAGEVEVQVLGTAFEVERVAERTHVRVEHGLVRVRWRGGETLLRAGEQGLFPPERQPLATGLGVAAAPPIAPTQVEPSTAEPSTQAAPTAELVPSSGNGELAAALEGDAAKPHHVRERWRALARAGKHKEAFGSLGQRPVDDLAGLLLAADAARLSGHPREAARHLERLIDRYPQSAPAHLAAFTLGRLALYELKQPGLAARSFARAHALNASGPLAEDALAREAEAYHRAGDAQRAKSAAERYLQRYPNGARKSEVARYLDAAPPAARGR